MIIKNDYMIYLYATFKGFLNLSLGWFGLMAIFQQFLDKELFEFLMAAMPSRVGMFFGSLYFAAIVFRKLSDSWTHHQINRLSVKKEKELLSQEEIVTEKDRKSLNKKK